MQTFYPEFESGQVLTNDHLNQLTTWLNEQQQASRRKLFGIGIVCGLEVTVALNHIKVTAGVAVTSAGHLMCQDTDRSYSRHRSYALPVSTVGDPALDGDDVTVPPLLTIPNITLSELLTDDFVPAPNEPPPGNLSAQFLAGKVVMLLLEAQRVSLKNCDINDCADKGARWQFTLRTLLLSESDAIALWQAETGGASELQPQDLNWLALRSQLQPLSLGKLVPGATSVNSLQALYDLAAASVAQGWPTLLANLQASFDTYAYLLRSRFSSEDFPTDPWTGIDPVLPAQAQTINELILGLHRYDLLQDAMASYNEFLETASQFDALCCPSPQRFAFHVLLGRPQPPQEAEVPGNRRGVQINFNIGAHTGLPYLRHVFYPCLQPGGQHQLGVDLVHLYYRTWLLLQRFSTDNLLGGTLKVMPSLLNAALSHKAIPYYLPLVPQDDLHRHWHPRATRLGLLNQVHGYHASPASPHPLTRVPTPHDFYRVEGVLGKPLGQLITELKVQQRQLGLSFGIEPVFLPVQDIDSEATRAALLALLLRDKTLVRLFKCKLSDIDVIFLLLLGFLFQLLLALIYLLTRMNTSAATTSPSVPSRPVINPALLAVNANDFLTAVNSGDRVTLLAAQSTLDSGRLSNFLQKQVRVGQLQAVDVIDALDEPDDRNGANATLYKQVKLQTSGDLFERVRKATGANMPEAQVQQTYQTMRMLQQSERLLQQASVSSVAQFDFDRFDADISELRDAYQGFKAQRPSNPSAEQQATLGAIDSNINMLSNLGGSALLSNLRSEFTARIGKVFSEFMFDGYNKRYPALEHLCGVPKGGTLVLVYTHKSLLQRQVPTTTGPVMATRNLRANTVLATAGSSTAVLARANELMISAARANATSTDNLSSMVSARRADASVSLTDMATKTTLSPAATKATRDAAVQRAEREAVLAEREVAAKRAEAAAAHAAREAEANRHKEAELAAAREAALVNATATEKRDATKAAKEAAAQAKREAAEIAELEKAAAAARAEAAKAAREADAAKKAEADALAAASTQPEGEAAADNTGDPRETTTRLTLQELGLSAALADDDPVNDLIVIADFCLPTYCCDSDCADLELQTPVPPPDAPPAPASITVSGVIVSNARQTLALSKLTSVPIADAILKVTDRKDQEVRVKMSRGSFLFTINPGTYTLTASAKGFITRTETLNITSPLGREVSIVLTADDGKGGGIDRGSVIGIDLGSDRAVLSGRTG